jgi:hypothetical protein
MVQPMSRLVEYTLGLGIVVWHLLLLALESRAKLDA